MKRIFITGAGGFIGRHLVAQLLKQNVEVVALMLPTEIEPEQFAGKVTIVRGDVRHLDKLSEEIGEFDTLFHLAAIVSDWGSKQHHFDITVTGTEQAIALALQYNAKFVVTTSVATFGATLGSGVLDENTPIGKPASSYEFVKQRQEAVTLDAVKNQGLNAVVIRPANVYGVGSIWVERYIELLSSQAPALMGDGAWDAGLVHVDNLISGMVLAAQSTKVKPGDIFIISDDPGVTWIDYCNALSATLNLPKAKSIPNIIAKILAPILDTIGKAINQKNPPIVTHLAYRLTGVESIYNNQKAKDVLGYQPSIDLHAAMAEIKSHYQAVK